jgi:hypothetical protein
LRVPSAHVCIETADSSSISASRFSSIEGA